MLRHVQYCQIESLAVKKKTIQLWLTQDIRSVRAAAETHGVIPGKTRPKYDTEIGKEERPKVAAALQGSPQSI